MAEKYGDLMRRDSTAAVDKASKLSSPPVGMFKLNVDAASGVGGIGAVIRNDNGEAMAAMALPFETATSTKHAEIMARQFGLNFAWDARSSSVTLESDSQAVINSINSDEDESFAPEGHLIDGVKRSLQQFQNATLFYSKGIGQVPEQKILTIDVKPGCKKGTKIACPDKGNEQLGQLPADVDFVIDHEKPHDTYKRDGKSPHCDPQRCISPSSMVVIYPSRCLTL
ncbi:unnamed protein product [Prunus armeniaca]